MTEMKAAKGAVGFPVYVVERISGEVDAYASYEVMQSFLEIAEVENGGYAVYDSEGFILRLELRDQKSSWLGLSRSEEKLTTSDFWELKFNSVTHEEPSRILVEPLLRRIGLTKG